MLGAPYTDELTRAEEMARKQAEQIAEEIVKQQGPSGLGDKQVVALIAYLQRLGVDLTAPAAPAGTPAPAAATATPVTAAK